MKGRYSSIEHPDIVLNFFDFDNMLFYNSNLDSTKMELFILDQSKFIDVKKTFFTLQHTNGNKFLKTNDMVYKKIDE